MKKEVSLLMYFVAAALGFAVLLIELSASKWDFSYWLSNPTVVLALGLSEVVVRVLAGFGLLVTYLAICEGMLVELSTTLKRRKTTAKTVFGFLIFLPVLLPIYSALRLLFSWFYGGSTTLFDMIYLLAGTWGLIISVYLLPISRGEFNIIVQRSDFKSSEGRIRKLGRKVKKLYHEKVQKQYAEAYRIEVERMRERLNAHRGKMGTALLLPFALGSLAVPPIAFLFMMLLIKGSIRGRSAGYGFLDRGILVAVMIAAGVLASIQIYMSLGSLQLMLGIGYLIGALIGYITFLYFARKTL
jgi:hypothetical protein